MVEKNAVDEVKLLKCVHCHINSRFFRLRIFLRMFSIVISSLLVTRLVKVAAAMVVEKVLAHAVIHVLRTAL